MRRPTLRTLLSCIIAVGVIVVACLMLSRSGEINSMARARVYHPEKKVEHVVEQPKELSRKGETVQSTPAAVRLAAEEGWIEKIEGGEKKEKDRVELEVMGTEVLSWQLQIDGNGEEGEEDGDVKVTDRDQVQEEHDLGEKAQEEEDENDDSEETTILGASSLPLPPARVPLQQPRGEGPYGIKYVVLIAERHSGSTWMMDFLQDYFRRKEVFVTSTLCTWKHWFQDRIYKDIQAGRRPCRAVHQCPACRDIQHTLVIAMWRNPYDWIGAMQKSPHHAKVHWGIQDLSEFMTKRWMLSTKNERAARADALVKAKNKAPCMDNFMPWEVVPCKPNDRASIYELDENGEAYSNVYELRKAKIRDFNAIQEWAPYYEKILYEDILVGNNLQEWLKSLDRRYGLGGPYETVPGAALSHKMSMSRSYMYYLSRETCVPHCAMGGPNGERARETLHGMWDAKLEEGLGYHKVEPKTAA